MSCCVQDNIIINTVSLCVYIHIYTHIYSMFYNLVSLLTVLPKHIICHVVDSMYDSHTFLFMAEKYSTHLYRRSLHVSLQFPLLYIFCQQQCQQKIFMKLFTKVAPLTSDYRFQPLLVLMDSGPQNKDEQQQSVEYA